MGSNELRKEVGRTMGQWSTQKTETLPSHGVNRDSGSASAHDGWLRRLVVRPGVFHCAFPCTVAFVLPGKRSGCCCQKRILVS